MRCVRSDRGALSTSVLVWILAAVGLVGTVATLGWVGALDDDEATATFRGVVVDSTTGEPLPGALVAATDVSGAVISGLSATTTVDGEYQIAGLTDDEYGLHVSGAAVGHETGYVAHAVGAYGHEVVASWGAAATYAPGVVGDIALDPLAQPTTTVPTTLPVTAVPTTGAPAPSTSAPTTTTGFLGPWIGELSASPALVVASPLCGTTSSQFSIEVTHPSGVKSVVVQWSYPTRPIGAGQGTASGTATLSPVPGTDTWVGGATFSVSPAASQTWMTLKVVATANDTYYRSRTFTNTLAITLCFIIT